MIKANLLTHHFLVATPTLADLNFAKAVVYIYEHTEDGALGMIINKPLQINLGTVLNHLDIIITQEGIADHPVLMGGPMGQEHGFIIYNSNSKVDDSKDAPEMLISASKEILKDIAIGKGPKDFVVTLGYSGWKTGQIEKEIACNDWLVVPFNREILFNIPMEKRWRATATLIGIDINQLSNQVGHA